VTLTVLPLHVLQSTEGRKIRCKDPKGAVPSQEYLFNT